MPSHRDPTSKRLLAHLERLRQADLGKIFDEVVAEPGETYDDVFNLRDDKIYLFLARDALRINVFRMADTPILTAFRLAGLDHHNPVDWRRLMAAFCETHFGQKRTKPVTWTPTVLLSAYKDYLAVQNSFEKKRPDLQVCKILKTDKRYKDKYGKYKIDTLRKLIRYANDPDHNTLLPYADANDPLLEFTKELSHRANVQWDERAEIWVTGMLGKVEFRSHLETIATLLAKINREHR
jgi:hypothetical protein